MTMASKGVNKVILVGNLGKDPETRFMPAGGAVTNILLLPAKLGRIKILVSLKRELNGIE